MTRMERIAKMQLVSETLQGELDSCLERFAGEGREDSAEERIEDAQAIADKGHKLFILRQFMRAEIQVAQAEAQAEELQRFNERGSKH